MQIFKLRLPRWWRWNINCLLGFFKWHLQEFNIPLFLGSHLLLYLGCIFYPRTSSTAHSGAYQILLRTLSNKVIFSDILAIFLFLKQNKAKQAPNILSWKFLGRSFKIINWLSISIEKQKLRNSCKIILPAVSKFGLKI